MAKSIFLLHGIEDYMAEIQQAGLDIVKAAERAVDTGSEIALAGMQRRVPKDTHNLEAHLQKELEVEGDTVVATVGIIAPDADTARYGTVQEFGSVSMPAHSYVRPTMDNDRRKILKAMKTELRDFIG